MNPLIFKTDTDTVELLSNFESIFLKDFTEKEEIDLFEKYACNKGDMSLIVNKISKRKHH